MHFYQPPAWTQAIRNHYWHLRFARGFDTAKIRKQYRLIEKEKKRLTESGVDAELVRLYCRHIVNPRNQKAEKRFQEAYFRSLQTSFDFG